MHRSDSIPSKRDGPSSLLEAVPVDQRVSIVAPIRLALAVLASDRPEWHARDLLAAARQSARHYVSRGKYSLWRGDSLDPLFGGGGLTFELVETPAAGL
jgi:hypothetical protein